MHRTSHLHFHGGAGEVTGANFLLESDSVRILVDCGMVHRAKFCDESNRDPFSYDPASIQHLFITHAHMDHIGRVPLLVARGFTGIIYSTLPTRDLAELMFDDALALMAQEAREHNAEPLYRKEDVTRALSLWETASYHANIELPDGFNASFKEAGHILGSAMIALTRDGKQIVFTGDLGNSPAPLAKDTDSIEGASYLVMESVYGDRNHEKREDRARILRDTITQTVEDKGVLLVPSFSLERTQVLLYEINNLVESGLIPEVPVFLDSPLAISITNVYRRHAKHFNARVQGVRGNDPDVFNFPNLHLANTVEESKEINGVPPPKVIIAGAGMSHGGRIQFHEKRYLADPSTTLLFVGFQVAGSLGRRLMEGEKNVTIMGEDVPVRARIETIRGYSAHKDRDALLSFVEGGGESLERVYVTMGEPGASQFLAQRIKDFLGVTAIVPDRGSRHALGL